MTRLDATAVDDFDDAGAEYGDVWNDDDDGTYAPVGNSSPSPDSRGVLDTYTGGEITDMSVHFRASATGDVGQPLMVDLIRPGPGYGTMMTFWGGDSTGRASNFYDLPVDWDIPNDDTFRDYSAAVDPDMLDFRGWDSLDELRPDLTAGGCFLYLWADGFYADGPPFPEGEIRISEAWLEVGVTPVAFGAYVGSAAHFVRGY